VFNQPIWNYSMLGRIHKKKSLGISKRKPIPVNWQN